MKFIQIVKPNINFGIADWNKRLTCHGIINDLTKGIETEFNEGILHIKAYITASSEI